MNSVKNQINKTRLLKWRLLIISYIFISGLLVHLIASTSISNIIGVQLGISCQDAHQIICSHCDCTLVEESGTAYLSFSPCVGSYEFVNNGIYRDLVNITTNYYIEGCSPFDVGVIWHCLGTDISASNNLTMHTEYFDPQLESSIATVDTVISAVITDSSSYTNYSVSWSLSPVSITPEGQNATINQNGEIDTGTSVGTYNIIATITACCSFSITGLLVVTPILDLDIDSDYDGSIDDSDDTIELSGGGMVAVGERTKIILRKVYPDFWNGTVYLINDNSGISVYDAEFNGTQISFDSGHSHAFYASNLPQTLYVQGDAASAGIRDKSLQLRYDSQSNETKEDSITFTVVGLKSLKVTDTNHVSNNVLVDNPTVVDMYVDDMWLWEAHIALNAYTQPDISGINNMSAVFGSHLKWKIDGDVVSPVNTGVFGSDLREDGITLFGGVEFGYDQDFTVNAGYDINKNNILDITEVTRKAKVHLISFDELKISDKNNDGYFVEMHNNAAEELFVNGNSSGGAIMTMQPNIQSDTPAVRSHVLWKLTEGTAIVSNGTFEAASPDMDITLPVNAGDTNKEFILQTGVDADADGVLDDGEIRYTADVYVIKPKLTPDYNHDRVIDAEDENKITESNPYRFWINDDDDDELSGSSGDDCPDEPASGHKQDWKGIALNGDVPIIDGVRDFVDFFPVFIDLKDTLGILGTTDYKYILKHADGSLNMLLANDIDITPETVKQFLINKAWCEANKQKELHNIPIEGVILPEEFLNGISAETKGVILVEGCGVTEAPLVLEIQKNDGTVICKTELPLKISGVEDMYRYLNLRWVCNDTSGGATHTGEPSNNPDALSNGRNIVFIHGFNEDANSARGNIAETFKRLYWSGNKAKYTGVTWYGDESVPTKYHANVTNAFETAPWLAAYLIDLHDTKNEEVNVIAFSLGNMVVSSAIQDHGASVDRYFMLHAAVAKEAYDSGEFDEDMIQSDWRDYTNRVYASKWYDLFPQGDGRHNLSWTGRFSSVVGPQVYNFFSSGDNVLADLTTGGIPPFDISTLWEAAGGRYAWCLQELWKGRHTDWIGGSTYGGWGFTSASEYNDPGLFDPDAAEQITPAELRAVPFFNSWTPVPSLLQEPENPSGAGSQFAIANRGQLLAEMIPAMSFAAGANRINSFDNDHNLDMNILYKNGWPAERHNDDNNDPWLHGDYRAVGYVYVYRVFDEIINIGGFEQ